MNTEKIEQKIKDGYTFLDAYRLRGSKSKVFLNCKQELVFDVEDDRHRKDFALFLKTGSWSHSKVRYKTRGFKNPIIEMYTQMMDYYVELELK